MVSIELVRAELEDAELIHSMKYESFLPLYERYRDDATSPVSEPLAKVIRQMREERTDYWLIRHEGENVGAVRVVSDGAEDGRSVYRLSPQFILPAYQNRGFGYAAMVALFAAYPQADIWRLATIKQERGNCHLYEKCGFQISSPEKIINERMALVFYQKEKPLFTLETARLRFRELTNGDYADVASVLLDDEVMRKTSACVSEALVRRWLDRKLEQYRALGHSHWHVSLKETGEFIGIIGIAPETVEGVSCTGLGYLVRKEHQRRGYAFEGAQACIEWAFRELHPAKIIAEVDETNLPSRRLAEKLGMVCERTFLRFNGEAELPHCLYAIESDAFSS